MFKYLFGLAISFALPILLLAQNTDDILRYSQLFPVSNAKSIGMGGAIGALGADFNSATINPAGLALAKEGKLIVSLGQVSSRTNSNYIDKTTFNNNFSLTVPSLGFMYGKDIYDFGVKREEGLVSYGFFFGYNRTDNYNRNFSFSGLNNSSSILDSYAESAFGINENDLGAGNSPASLAYNTYLISPTASGSTVYEAEIPANQAANQSGIIQRKGRMHEWNLAGGLNFSNRVYIGLSANLHSFQFENNSDYRESYTQTNYGGSGSMRHQAEFRPNGTAVSAKFGVLFRIFDEWRAGIAFHTPKTFSISEFYEDRMTSQGFFGAQQNWSSDPGTFDYRINTPSRVVFSNAFIIDKVLSITTDIDRINYKNGSIISEFDFSDVNKDAQEIFRTAHNIKIGVEFNYFDMRFRGGYSFYGSPYDEDRFKSGINHNINIGHAGIGYHPKKNGESFFIDLGLQIASYSDLYTPYFLSANSTRSYFTATNKTRFTQFIISLGFNIE